MTYVNVSSICRHENCLRRRDVFLRLPLCGGVSVFQSSRQPRARVPASSKGSDTPLDFRTLQKGVSMQVVCKPSQTSSDVLCPVCGEGFLLYWERTCRNEQSQ